MMNNRQGVLATALAFGMAAAIVAPSAGVAQDAGEVAPVLGVHSGTCGDWVSEPAYDLGVFEVVPVAGEGVGDAGTVDDEEDVFGDGFLDDSLFDDKDEGYLSEDVDGDGVIEIGGDLDSDGFLDDDEILGEDLNDDAALDDAELLILPIDLTTAGTIWKVDTDTEEFDGTELVTEGPYVLVVHKSVDQYDTVLACGSVSDLVEEDQVVVPLRPAGDANYSGVALIEEDNGEYVAYLFRGAAPGTGR